MVFCLSLGDVCVLCADVFRPVDDWMGPEESNLVQRSRDRVFPVILFFAYVVLDLHESMIEHLSYDLWTVLYQEWMTVRTSFRFQCALVLGRDPSPFDLVAFQQTTHPLVLWVRRWFKPCHETLVPEIDDVEWKEAANLLPTTMNTWVYLHPLHFPNMFRHGERTLEIDGVTLSTFPQSPPPSIRELKLRCKQGSTLALGPHFDRL